MTKHRFMRQKIFALLIPLSLVISCSQPAKKSEVLTVLDLSQDITVVSEMKLSQIASDINYTKLESNPDCFIKRIDQYSMTDNYILIYDQSQPKVLLFDRHGKFLRNIGNIGKGPGEFNRPSEVRISRDERNILIMDYLKVMRFGFDGQLIGETKLPDIARHVDTFGDGLIGYFSSNSTRMDNYSNAFFDWDGNCTGKLLKRDEDKIKRGKGSRLAMFYRMNDEIRINDLYSDTVFAIRLNRTLVPVIVINDPHAKEERTMGNMNFQLDVWMETPDYLFFYGFDNDMVHPMYLEKKTGSIYHIPWHKDLHTMGIPNDLDGGAPFWPKRYQNGSVFTIQEANTLKSVLDHELIAKSIFENQGLRDQLVSFRESLSDEDGPVLIEVKLR